MKKTCKRLGAIFLAMAMAVSVLCTGAMASDFTINITSKTTGHTYEAYQVFTGTLDSTKKILSDIQWGSAIKDKSDDFLTALKADSTIGSDFTDITTADKVAEKLATYTGENDNKAKAFAAVVGNFIDTNSVTTTLTSGEPVTNTGDNTTYTYKIDTNAAGYYFVRDTAKDVSHTEYILSVVGSTDVTSKDGTVPTVDKDVTTTGQKAETANIGDSVKFILTGTLPDNLDSYKTYEYEFVDTLSKGLTYNGDVKVYVQNGDSKVEIANSSYTVTPAGKQTDTDASSTLNVKFNNLKAATAAKEGETVSISSTSKIIVEYTATLNQYAEIGTTGNTNKVKLEYSNDPNKDGTGTTTEKEVFVYTFQIDVDKYATGEETKKLPGAEFILTREVKTGEGEATKTQYAIVEDGKLKEWSDSKENATTLKTDNQGKISVAGLEAGTYYLKETKAPDGYNLLTDKVTVTITATMGTGTEANVLKTLTSTVNNENNNNIDLTEGIVTVKVANSAGSQLPSTGGMGTTLFYVIGGALMAGAAIVLVIKKKRSSAE